MDDQSFFDTLYAGWSKTTGAENTYWMPVEILPKGHDDEREFFDVVAVDEKDNRTLVASGLLEADAAWITALHGCFGDLTRRLHQAVDEAERFDTEKDRVISELALAEIENNDLREQLEGYRQRYG